MFWILYTQEEEMLHILSMVVKEIICACINSLK